MVKGLVGIAHGLVLEGKESEIPNHYVHYDEDDEALVTQFDSHVFTQWKQGAESNVLLNPVVQRSQVVIKDIPFEVKKVCNC